MNKHVEFLLESERINSSFGNGEHVEKFHATAVELDRLLRIEEMAKVVDEVFHGPRSRDYADKGRALNALHATLEAANQGGQTDGE